MTQAVKGVIAGAKGAPVRVETILVPDPGGSFLQMLQRHGASRRVPTLTRCA